METLKWSDQQKIAEFARDLYSSSSVKAISERLIRGLDDLIGGNSVWLARSNAQTKVAQTFAVNMKPEFQRLFQEATTCIHLRPTTLAADLPPTAVAAESIAPLLSIKGLSVRFGGILALDNVSFDVKAGQICGLIGPNGAGKTTLFNCLSRLYQAGTGTIHFAGERLLRLPRHRVARLGIGRTFQNLALFQTMSVRDNVLIGGHCRSRSGFVANALRLPIVGREERLLSERAKGLLKMLELTAIADVPVSALPFWTRKRVELARALASEPKLLLLDEPAAGLNHADLGELGQLIVNIRDRLGITILLVEHHMSLVMRVSDQVVALEFGHKIADGTPAEVQKNPDVIRAYLGGEL